MCLDREKSGKTLVEARSDTERANRSFYLGMETKDKSNHLTADSLRSFFQEIWSLIALSHKANDQRNRERVVVDLFSKFEWVRSSGYFW